MDCLRKLLRAGAPPGYNGAFTPLRRIVFGHHFKCADALLRDGADCPGSGLLLWLLKTLPRPQHDEFLYDMVLIDEDDTKGGQSFIVELMKACRKYLPVSRVQVNRYPGVTAQAKPLRLYLSGRVRVRKPVATAFKSSQSVRRFRFKPNSFHKGGSVKTPPGCGVTEPRASKKERQLVWLTAKRVRREGQAKREGQLVWVMAQRREGQEIKRESQKVERFGQKVRPEFQDSNCKGQEVKHGSQVVIGKGQEAMCCVPARRLLARCRHAVTSHLAWGRRKLKQLAGRLAPGRRPDHSKM